MNDTDPFAHWPDRTPTYDNGDLLFVASVGEETRSGRQFADGVWHPAAASATRVAATIMEAMPHYGVSSSDEALIAELIRRGATQHRHAHVMSHRLDDIPAMPSIAGLTIAPLDASQLDESSQILGQIAFDAYAGDHPDREHIDVAAAVDELRAISRGELLGPYLGAISTIAISPSGDVLGACLVVDREGVPPDGGPWIIDVFRDPTSPVKGVGRSLLIGALASARLAGVPGVSLAVTHDNTNALELYAAVGFDDAEESWTVHLP